MFCEIWWHYVNFSQYGVGKVRPGQEKEQGSIWDLICMCNESGNKSIIVYSLSSDNFCITFLPCLCFHIDVCISYTFIVLENVKIFPFMLPYGKENKFHNSKQKNNYVEYNMKFNT